MGLRLRTKTNFSYSRCIEHKRAVIVADIEIELEGSVKIVLALIDIGRTQGGFEDGSLGVERDRDVLSI